MPGILDITTSVPPFKVSMEELVKFYSESLDSSLSDAIPQKLTILGKKTKIRERYSCIPDFNSAQRELFKADDPFPTVDLRMAVYREKVMPLVIETTHKLLQRNAVLPAYVTHLITVSCTGLFAPGMEFLVAEHFGLEHAEKYGLYFLGCYAALKALKQAHMIALANPEACVLIICAELCSLHFNPSVSEEDMVANLLFGDGCAATLVCGDKNSLVKNRALLLIDKIGTASIPDTMDLMTWTITPLAFRMYLDKGIVKAIRENIQRVCDDFLEGEAGSVDLWAIHPGGIRIIEAVQTSLGLNHDNVREAMEVMRNYGNMSSPTILFILSRMLNRLKEKEVEQKKKVFSCAFGPGLTVEMISFSYVHGKAQVAKEKKGKNYAI